jgi:lipopolysaccharide/colanic/teichoic acid biosynthesis glycosyltransferase
MGPAGQACKRLLDVAVAGLGLLLASPVLLALAAAVRATSPGPVLFRQERLGRAGRNFRICKFRSMYVDVPDLRNADGSSFSSGQDPRVTPVGRFLRRTSLDELPQLINVLAGDMSLVGPRPDQVDQLRYYTAGEHSKLLVKPGLTGLAQISGRNTISWEVRKRLDIDYVQTQSLRLDLGILLRTVPYVFLHHDINTEP